MNEGGPRVDEGAPAPADSDASDAKAVLRRCLQDETEPLLDTIRLYVLRFGPSPPEDVSAVAQDILQEVSLEALEHADRFKAGRRPLPWLLGIALNLVRQKRVERARQARREWSAGACPALAGELVRFVYLLVQRLRSARAPQPRAEMAPITLAWANVAVRAVATGLWVAADVLFLDGLLDVFDLHYVLGPLAPLTPTLGYMAFAADGIDNPAPWLVLAPLVALLILYASLNLVGFGLWSALRRSPEPEQR
jgi:DNA-directed RNA polymerase specialized sigma24 family protein